MTSQSNIFRLQRLNKTMKARESHHGITQHAQSTKFAVLNSISRGIKYNDVSFMSGRNLQKLRKQPDIGDDIEYENAHHNLEGVRKNYDSTHDNKNQRQGTIAKLQEQKRKLSISETQLRNKREKGNQQVRKLNESLQQTKLNLIEIEMQKKVLLHIRNRLKSDKIVYDYKKYNMEKQLKQLSKQRKLIDITKNDYQSTDDRTSKVYKKFVTQVSKQQQERQSHIRNIEEMIEQKQRVSQVNDFRTKEMQDIAEKAMQDKDDNQKSWQKILLANKFLSRLLRDKMNRQMIKFITVETAFKNIKISTGVLDGESFTQKFLNKESSYGDLLGKIAENQKKIAVLKQQGDEIVKQCKKLEAEKEVIDNIKRPITNVQGQLKKLGEMDKKQQNSQLYRQKVRTWLSKTNKKMNNILGSQFPTIIERGTQSIAAAFIQYLNNLVAELDRLKPIQVAQQTKHTEQLTKQPKLIRIKDEIANYQQELEQNEINLDDDHDENDMVSNQRINILRCNEKFMKEVKKKYDEKRKLAAVEIMVKKKPEIAIKLPHVE